MSKTLPTKRVRRSAATSEANNVSLKSAEFLSVVKKPANQRAFSIVRSEDGKPATSKRIRPAKARRSDTAKLARVEFPADLTQEQVEDAVAGLSLEGFEVKRSADDQPWQAVNSAIVCTEDQLLAHRITEDGIVAYVLRTEETEGTSGLHKITVAALRFDDEEMSREDVEGWLSENDVDFDAKALNNSSGKFVLQRAELEEGAETRQIELAEGVVAVIARSAQEDIPTGFVLVVNELAYSGYGWGQLDFVSYMTDRTVGEGLRQAQCYLSNVLDNILYYNSDLTVDAKKALVSRSVDQFAAYVHSLLDALPRSLMIQVSDATNIQRSESVTAKESASMSKDTNAPVATGLTTAQVAETVREVLRSEREAEQKANEEKAAETLRQEEATKARRSEIAEIVKEANAPLLEEIAKLKGTTVLRSADTDVDTKEKDLTKVKRTAGVFDGMLGDLHGLRDLSEIDAEDEEAEDESGDE